eukprot:4905-Heterococcus_DN1.PRE.4
MNVHDMLDSVSSLLEMVLTFEVLTQANDSGGVCRSCFAMNKAVTVLCYRQSLRSWRHLRAKS